MVEGKRQTVKMKAQRNKRNEESDSVEMSGCFKKKL